MITKMSISKLVWASATQAEAYQVDFEASNISLKTLAGLSKLRSLGPVAIKNLKALALNEVADSLVVFREALPLTFENVQPFSQKFRTFSTNFLDRNFRSRFSSEKS